MPVTNNAANTQQVIQTFTGNGTYTPTTGMKYCIIEVVGGGGGGGGGAATSAGQLAMAGGGGGGEYARGIFSASTIGNSQTVTVGTGGNGGNASPTNGSTGNTTSVGSLITAIGGSGGTASAVISVSNIAAGGSGGTGGTGGSFRVPGRAGNYGLAHFGFFQTNGTGGSSVLSGQNTIQTTDAVGTAGLNYGGGGNGAYCFTSSAGRSGGAGSAGIVIITEFI